MKKIIFILCFQFVFFSCSKDETSSGIAEVDAGNVVQNQVASVTLPNEGINQNIYTITEQGIPLNLVKSGPNQLLFLIPNDMPVGQYSITIEELNATIKFNVNPIELTDSADITMTDFFNNLSTYSQTIDTSTPEGSDVFQTITNFVSFYSNSSQAQKDAIALVYKANKTRFDNFLLSNTSGRQSTLSFSDFFSRNAQATYQIALGTALIVTAPAAFTGVAAVAIGTMGVLVAKKGCELAYRENKDLIDNVYNNIKFKIDGWFGNNRMASEKIILTDNIVKEVSFEVVKRKIILSDQNKTTPLANLYFDSFNRYNEYTNRVNQTIQNLSTSSNFSTNPILNEILPTSSPEITENISQEVFSNATFSINNNNISLQQATLQNGLLNLKATIVGNPNSNSVISELKYSYNNEFSEFTGTLSLRLNRSIIGTWVMESFANGIPVGQYETSYFSSCPSISERLFTFLSSTSTYNSNGTYSDVANTKYVELNKTINTSNCTVINDAADTSTTFNDTSSGTYVINGANLEIVNSDGDEFIVPLTFLSTTKIKVGEYILNKQ